MSASAIKVVDRLLEDEEEVAADLAAKDLLTAQPSDRPLSRPSGYRSLAAAVTEYKRRVNRQSHPKGTFEKNGAWYPDPDREEQDCCAHVRRPSRAWPYSLMKHCRSVEHVAALFGVPVQELRRAAR